MNTYTVKILVFFLSLFILITVSSQIYLRYKEDYKTETAMLYVASERIPFKGVYVRNETVINYSAGGVVSYPLPDGSKVSKDSVVAEVYSSEYNIAVNGQLSRLRDEIELLEEAQSPGTTALAQPELLSKLIDQQYSKITGEISTNDLSDLSEDRKELLKLMSILNIVVDKEENYNSRIEQLRSRYDTLMSSQLPPVETVTVDTSGYFVSYTDGFEDRLSLDNIYNISADTIKSVIDSDTDVRRSGEVGKLIDGYDWKMIGIINNEDRLFLQGAQVDMKLSSLSYPLPVTIEAVIDTDNPRESIVILTCDKLTYDLVQRRVERVELILTDFSGIKVSRKAINFNAANEKGVYVKLGNEIYFKKLDVIYEQDSFVISRKTSDKSYLQLYDDIVVEGVSAAEAAKTDTTVSESETAVSENEQSTTTVPSA